MTAFLAIIISLAIAAAFYVYQECRRGDDGR